MTTTSICLDQPVAPPAWALLQRRLFDAQADACRAFFDTYFEPYTGYLRAVPRWGGNDGPDDAAENQQNWTTLYALGGAPEVLDLFRTGFEGHLRQYTEAKTVDVPMGRDGMYYKEFPVSLDWLHHGEGFAAYFVYGLCDPGDATFERRMRRWTGFYDGSDPSAPNYDPKHRVIRSMFTGSRGPLLRKATGLDWAGDPIEVEGRFQPAHGEHTYSQFLEHFEEYNDIVGDHPLNLEATHLGLGAYLVNGDDRHRDWVLGYVDAWAERTRANGGVIPSNVGLDGVVGSAAGGKWYGGVYGWDFRVIVPQTGQPAYRNVACLRAHHGFGNALLLTGDSSYVDLWRGVIDTVNGQGRQFEGQMRYPKMHGDEGWYDFHPQPFSWGAQEVWYWSQRDDDRARVAGDPWVRFVTGQGEPDWPERALEGEWTRLRAALARMEADDTSPDARMSDDMMNANPAVTETLVRQTMGGMPVGPNVHTLHARLRWFDADTRRPGLPEAVAALVDDMSDGHVRVRLVNTDPVRPRRALVQGGAYGEHKLTTVRVDDGEPVDVAGGSSLQVELRPGCGATVTLGQQRFARTPGYAFPWDR
jgi:hypothetical protein